MYNLYLILEGVVNGRVLLNFFPNLSECGVALQGLALSWPVSLDTGTDITLVCERIKTLHL